MYHNLDLLGDEASDNGIIIILYYNLKYCIIYIFEICMYLLTKLN